MSLLATEHRKILLELLGRLEKVREDDHGTQIFVVLWTEIERIIREMSNE